MGKMVGLLGHPVGHSLSPKMQNAAFNAAGLDFHYEAFDVLQEQLPAAVHGMRALGFRGCNVTIPHKVSVMEVLDWVSEEAKAIGAVNTILIEEGKLLGYNTDGRGYLRSLVEETAFEPQGSSVLMLGSGGAARAVGYALLQAGTKRLYLANRNLARAEELGQQLQTHFPQAVIQSLPLSKAEEWVSQVQLLVNTTSIGMSPQTEGTPLPVDSLRGDVLVSDLVYNPRRTLLLREAAQRGLQTHGGVGMFIYQGALAFELWSGESAPIAVMRAVLEKQS